MLIIFLELTDIGMLLKSIHLLGVWVVEVADIVFLHLQLAKLPFYLGEIHIVLILNLFTNT